MLSDPEPYESSIADIKILEDEILPINEAFQKVFGTDKELKLNSIKLAIGSRYNDYVTIAENDLVKFDVKPTLTGLLDFIIPPTKTSAVKSSQPRPTTRTAAIFGF